MLDPESKVVVDAAVIVSSWVIYRDDASYAVEVRNAHPGRFALVKPLNPEELLQRIAALP